MHRDILLLTEMIDAAEQAQQLTTGITVGQLETARQRRAALLWNFTVLGEAAGQLSAEIKDKFPEFSDSHTVTSGRPHGDAEPTGPILRSRGGGGTSHYLLSRWWAWPLPPSRTLSSVGGAGRSSILSVKRCRGRTRPSR